MINFILPHCYYNDTFNQNLRNYIRVYPQRLNFSERINIFAQYGNFPFSFWHGGINTNIKQDKLMLYSHINDYSNHLSMPIILDFSNNYLTLNKNWIYDPHIQMTLKLFDNQGNYIKVNSDIVQLQIQKFFNYNFILKTDNLNNDINYQNYDFIETAQQDNNLRNLILYPLRSKCCFCANNCHNEEELYQFTFSEKSIRTNCDYAYPTLEDVRQNYQMARSQGYTNFYFEEMPPKDIVNFNSFLLHFFIKPEFHQSFLEGVLT